MSVSLTGRIADSSNRTDDEKGKEGDDVEEAEYISVQCLENDDSIYLLGFVVVVYVTVFVDDDVAADLMMMVK